MMTTINNYSATLSLVLVAGSFTSVAEESPATLEPSVGTVHRAAHIYYNAVSGERVVTQLQGQVSGAESDITVSPRIWATPIQNACEANGYTTSYFFAIDNPSNTSGGSPDRLSTNITNLDYGDLPSDTVVDCIEINWVTAHADVDLDSDGVGDGVEELAGQWTVWDLDNGRAVNDCNRAPLVDLLFYNLAGNISGEGQMTGYIMDVDLVGYGTATDLSFEICDTDGDCQTAAYCHSMVDYDSDSVPDGPIGAGDRDFDGLLDSDLDGDGLSDWSWTIRFYQPGIGNDFDSDSDTGTLAPTTADTIGISFGFPEGSAVDQGDGTWVWNIDEQVSAPGTGEEDRFAQYNPPNGSGNIYYEGGYWFGGFACEGGLLDEGGTGYTPPAMFQFAMYGPGPGSGGCVSCPNDINCDGEINFFDISEFIVRYQNGDDYNGDGMTNFFDVSQFLQDYSVGCP